MGRLIARLSLALLLLPIGLLLLNGCDDGASNPVPPSGDGRSYGPPHEAVVFADDDGYLATVQAVESNTEPAYVRGVGNSGPVTDMGSFLVKPNSTVDNPYFAVYDATSSELRVLDNDGADAVFFSGAEIVRDLYAFSAGGSRIIYVQENNDNTQSLVVEGVTTDMAPTVYATLDPGDEFIGRPTTYVAGSIRVAITVRVNGQYNIHVYDTDGLQFARTVNARSLAYNNSSGSDRRLAYIEGDPLGTAGSELVLLNESLTEFKRIPFGSYGDGALALAWGPETSNKVALFAGSANDTFGNLIVIDTATEVITEVIHDGDYRFPFSSERMWGMPSWVGNGSGLVFSVRVGESEYQVIRANLDGTSYTLYEGLTETTFVDYID